MSPITHALLSWLVGAAPRASTRRERVLVTLAGLAPDIDGLGAVPDLITRSLAGEPTRFFHDWHRTLGHNVGFALAVAAAALALAPAGARLRTAALAGAALHLHLLCDLAGSRGPDGHVWPVPYLLPFAASPVLSWSRQWALNAWPNFAITAGALALVGTLAVRRGHSIVEVLSARADASVVAILKHRFRGEEGTP